MAADLNSLDHYRWKLGWWVEKEVWIYFKTGRSEQWWPYMNLFPWIWDEGQSGVMKVGIRDIINIYREELHIITRPANHGNSLKESQHVVCYSTFDSVMKVHLLSIPLGSLKIAGSSFPVIPRHNFCLKKHLSSLGVWILLLVNSADSHINCLNTSSCSQLKKTATHLPQVTPPSLLPFPAVCLVRLWQSLVKSAGKKTAGGYYQPHCTSTTCQQIIRRVHSRPQQSGPFLFDYFIQKLTRNSTHAPASSSTHICRTTANTKWGQMHTVPFFCQFLWGTKTCCNHHWPLQSNTRGSFGEAPFLSEALQNC